MPKGAEYFNIRGVDETIKNMHRINGACARPAVAQGMRKGLAVIRKAIKRECDHPSVAATVASRFTRGKKKNTRIYAKVGLGVGKRRPGRFNKSGGAGMSNRNIHWYGIGMTKTMNRVQYTTGRRTGRMWTNKARPEPVKRGYASSRGAAISVIKSHMSKVFIKKTKERITKKIRTKVMG